MITASLRNCWVPKKNNWIQVVYFKLKEIWPLFCPANAKKQSSILLPFRQSKWKYESMKPNLSQKAMKLTEELFVISWIEFKLFISNWKWFDCYFPLLKPKKWACFLNEIKSQSKFGLEVGPNDNTSLRNLNLNLMNWIQVVYFKLKELWPLFSPAKAKKPSLFFTSLPPKQMKIWKYETKSQSKGLEVSLSYTYIYIGHHIYTYTLYSKL